MLTNIFDIPERPTGQQKNFLKIMSNLPSIKRSMGDAPDKNDEAVASEAKQVLSIIK